MNYLMPIQSELPRGERLLRCPRCSQLLPTSSERCPSCDFPLHSLNIPTLLLQHPPTHWQHERCGRTRLLAGWGVVLQVLPSGSCVTLPVKERLLLGRGPAMPAENLIDLTPHKGLQRGVSRRHCLLVRDNDHLYIIDLDSSNGTLLNGEPLVAHRRYMVADNDKLVLGSMHIGVSFFASDSPPSIPSR